MGGPEKPTLSPEQLRLQEQAKVERIDAIRDRVSDETRETLLRFGRKQALAGTSGTAPSGGGGLLSSVSSLFRRIF